MQGAAGAILAACVLGSCTSSTVNGDECEPILGEDVYIHACQHGDMGPFEAVQASPHPDGWLAATNTTQHVFDVHMNAGEAEGPSRWYVGFRPSRDGAHAVFIGATDEDIDLEVFVADERLERDHQEVVSNPSGCGEMSRVDVFTFERGTQYTLAFGPTDAPSVRVFFEHPDTFGRGGWESRCDD
ncbi:MAG: hypothetical protein B7733_14755 [Myxococcales bacterium FL481]|nr:MAG: hypothetical protein B7733_14755 [Myxococcales bacterium FL481]